LRFAKKIGVAHTSIASMLPDSRESKPGFEVLAKITEAYPTISEAWLLTGEGEPFKGEGTLSTKNVHKTGTFNSSESSGNKVSLPNVATPGSTDIEYYRQRVKELEQQNSKLLEQLIQALTKKE